MAFKSGNLTGRDQSRIQRWALAYHQFSDRRERSDRHYEINKLLHFILRGINPKLHEAAFPSVESDDPDVIPGHTYGVDDLEGLEKLLKNIDGLTTKTQTSLDDTEWSEWR